MDPAAALAGLCDRAIETGVTPGGVVAIADADAALTSYAFGSTADRGDEEATVATTTIYDLASLTKPMATAALAMRAVAAGTIALDDRAVATLPELTRPAAETITIRHLLGHASGLPPHVRFFDELFANPAADAKAALLERALATDPIERPGASVAYSDVGYILLGALLERAMGASLDALFRDQLGEPLGLNSVTWGSEAPDVAPSERAPESGELLRGIVHDENARAGGGVFGHAGLFGNAGDVLRFALEIGRGARGEANRVAPAKTIAHFVRSSAAPSTSWRLGWDTPSPPPVQTHAGDRWPRDGFGHLGYTGTSVWLDPRRGRVVVILTNRVYRSRDAAPIRDFRRQVMDAVVVALG